MKTTITQPASAEIQTIAAGGSFSHEDDMFIVLDVRDVPTTTVIDYIPAASLTTGRVTHWPKDCLVIPRPHAFIVHDIAAHVADIMRRIRGGQSVECPGCGRGRSAWPLSEPCPHGDEEDTDG